MTADGKSWFRNIRRLGRSHLATQAAVLLPVLAIAGLTAWTMLSAPTNAKGQVDHTDTRPAVVASPNAAPVDAAPAKTETVPAAATPSPPPQSASLEPPPPSEPPAVNGLKISSQSWRRGGLGSNALVTFTLRNENDYAVKDIEIACAFSRRDGSHLTDRKRIIPDAVVNMKGRKTIAHMHIGYVNINANKAKCTAVAANRV